MGEACLATDNIGIFSMATIIEISDTSKDAPTYQRCSLTAILMVNN